MMVLPHVNMNGTSQKDLFWANRHALDSIKDAIEKLSSSMPHGRDYINSDDARSARAQHLEMLEQLNAMRVHLETVCEHLVDYD